MKVFTLIVLAVALGAWVCETMGWLTHKLPLAKPPPDPPPPPPPRLWRE